MSERLTEDRLSEIAFVYRPRDKGYHDIHALMDEIRASWEERDEALIAQTNAAIRANHLVKERDAAQRKYSECDRLRRDTAARRAAEQLERDRLRAALVAVGAMLHPCDCGRPGICKCCQALKLRAEALGLREGADRG